MSIFQVPNNPFLSFFFPLGGGSIQPEITTAGPFKENLYTFKGGNSFKVVFMGANPFLLEKASTLTGKNWFSKGS